MRTRHWAGLLAAGLLMSPVAHATDGYFSHGYGVRSAGMGGVGVAIAQEPFGGAINPATAGFLGNVWQVGLTWFSPDRSAERVGSGMAGIDGSVRSDSRNFGIPEFGVNWVVNPAVAVGLTVYGNGGMNTDYPGGQIAPMSACGQFNPPRPGVDPDYNLLCGNGQLGVNLTQLMIAPYVAWKFHPDHAVGIAPTIAYQRFKAYGLQAFDNPFLSTSPGSVTNVGYDDSWGFGVRVGYMGNFGPVSVGAAYATKMSMDEFGDYRGLFAEAGDFDIPSNFTVGAAWRALPGLLLSLEYQKIYYSDAKAVNNPSMLIGYCAQGDRSACMGGSNGAGFGWQDIDVWKFGVAYQIDPRWTVRAGYNRSENPIRPEDVTFNILAPGVMEDHYTVGGTYSMGRDGDISLFYMYAPEVSVTGTSLFVGFGAPPTTTETIRMKEWSLGIAYSRPF
jgi:long-chain fatty acid transport protein